MKRTLLSGVTAMLAAGLGGCDSQAGTAYEGESLFTVRGEVVLENPEAPATLVPALAYLGEYQGSDAFFVQDVSVKGSFPASFQLDVHEPPPEEMLFPTTSAKDAPRMAFAYITAVPPEHDAELRFSEDIWQKFGGLSQNFVVVYFDAEVAAGGVMSHVIAKGRALDAGYHLLEERPDDPAEYEASDACASQAVDEILAEYNAQNGTAIDRWGKLPDRDAVQLELVTRMVDRDCSLLAVGAIYDLVDPSDEKKVSIQIAADVKPTNPFGVYEHL